MSIRKSNFRNDSVLGSVADTGDSGAKPRRRKANRRPVRRITKDRRSLVEALEQRQLLAGPNLVGIQPNEGSLLFDGIELNSSPRELVFRFDDSAPIDPDSLGGIRITRSGADGVFESAIATSDLGTNGLVLLEFRAAQAGTAGEGLVVNFTSSSRVGSGAPLISVENGEINIDLNSNPARPTQVRDLISGVAADPVASQLLEVYSVSGASLAPLGTTVPSGTSVTLRGANAADATSDLGTSGDVRVRFLSTQPGPEGRSTQVVLQRADAGGAANPLVLVDGNRVTVRVNSNAGNETTVAGLINAINSNPEASRLILAIQESGQPTTLIGNRPALAQTLLLTGANDIVVEPGFVGLGDSPNEVVFRFAERLPDDTYQIDIFGSGINALANVDGEQFNDGENFGKQFRVNLAPQVVAVVPEPIRRQGNGPLNPEIGVIDVHFSETLDIASATNRDFYQLIFTRDTASPLDDVIIHPTSVSYDQATNIAKLTFPGPLARLTDPAGGGFLTGAARLRIGNAQINPGPPTNVSVVSEPGDSFDQAYPIGNLTAIDPSGVNSIRLNSTIRNTVEYGLQFPGGPGAPGVRGIRPEDPSRVDRPVPLDFFRQGADSSDGITTIQYEFPSTFRGDDPTVAGVDNLKTYFNLITEQQKRRVREVLSLFSEYLGVQFVEATNGPTQEAFFSFAVGDLYGANVLTTSGPGGLAVATRDRTGDGFNDLVVLDFQDFQQSTEDGFGGAFFRGAMLAIGQVIGFGFADSLPQPVTQSSDFIFNPGTSNEPTYPSVADIVNGQFLYRPVSNDIDLYRFSLSVPSRVSIQTFAERLSNASLLDTHLRLYRVDEATGAHIEVSQNDDYFGNDSLIELDLTAGQYVVGVSASGNGSYNPNIPGSGIGGRSEGDYELRITTKATANQGIRDATGVLLDGNRDGNAGGVYDFWFVPADQSNTLFVDKAATSTGNGTVAQPFRNLSSAVAAATPGTTIRMVANGGSDGRLETVDDNFSYQIGLSPTGSPLADGTSLDVPRGVRLVIDAGVVIKMRQARIGVGSTSPTVNRSDAAIQILGTPTLIGADGLVARNDVGEPIPGNVIITSINDRTVGNGNAAGGVTTPQAGDWGGIDLRGDIDFADSTRRNRENEGIFLNHIQFADLRFGGGQVSVDGRSVAVAPVDMAMTRATITNSLITRSAGAAIAATPNTFRETRFDEPVFQQAGPFTPAVSRVGPDIHGNRIVDNSIDGLFVRIATRTGDALQPLTTSARFDDTDIVHVISENLVIQGNPGGAVAASQAPSSLLIQGEGLAGGGEVQAGEYVYRIAFTSPTTESLASTMTASISLQQSGQIRLSQLPVVAAGSGFTGRRLYRAAVAADGTVDDFRLVAELNANQTSYTDRAATGTQQLPPQTLRLTARPDARLAIDAGTIVKLSGARIDVNFGANLIAEGDENNPVVFTSLQDQRYGAGGSFDTNQTGNSETFGPGDWGGIYVGHTSSANLDSVVIAGAGGTTRVPGGFASFNPIEVHQGQLRLANSRLEMNADGRGFIDGNQLDRAGRGENASATVFVRGAQPVVVDNVFVDGDGPVLSFDVNSMIWDEVSDPGRATGVLDAVDAPGNSGPLVMGNRLDGNTINGMEIRGGQVATDIVWDDVDIVHVVRDTIEVPNQHVFGGLRLESDARGSLVVKFANTPEVPATATTPSIPARTAGIVVGGSLTSAAEQFVDIPDRIGGSLQVIGHADFPVVLTSLLDDSIGAGFTPAGLPQTNTGNVESVRGSLPTGPQVDRGNLIDNDVPQEFPGFFEALIGNGNEVTNSGVTVQTGDQLLVAENFVFQYSTFVVVDGEAFQLSTTEITQAATLIDDDRVESRGTFDGANGVVEWIATSYFESGNPTLFSNLALNSLNGEPLGDIQVISYLDEDIPPLDDDILFTVGTPGEPDFRAFTVDNQSRVGFSQGGFYVPDGFNLANATYDGWAADLFPLLLGQIEAGTQEFSIAGEINLANLPAQEDLRLGTFFGPGDVTTAFAWSTDPTATSARITSFLELIPEDPGAGAATPGSWNGIVIREAANDRNVAIHTEIESRNVSNFDTNSVPGTAQFLGELAPDERSGDENRRLGLIVDGSIKANDDVDVYSFIAEAGTQVWLDIDRTSLSLNSVIELIDANGNILVLSDSSLRESRGDLSRLVPDPDRFSPDQARSLNVLPIPAGSPLAAYQDAFSINPNDPGMRIILPGSLGQRNLYHVRVRSSNVVGSDRSTLTDPALIRAGTTSGNYQLQIRLRETVETAGTQLRHADVRFATNGVQIVGGPINGPLVGDIAETTADNNSFENAQPLGLFEVGVNADLDAVAGPLSSNRMSTTIAGMIDSETDVDWYRFDIDYRNLTRDDANLFLATIFDIDYADGFARGDLALYVFNAAGELVLMGTDSNIADDQPTGLSGADSSDLSRGSAGTLDPYIGVAELPEGRYFVAVSNQTQIPAQLDQFGVANALNPLLRLEPIDSVRRIVEDRIGGSSFSGAVPPLISTLFDPATAAVPLSLNDVVLYSINPGGSVNIRNPFTGANLGQIGAAGTGFQDFAFLPNGELFGFSLPDNQVDPDLDNAYSYFRISSEDGSLVNLGLTGLQTFHAELDDEGNPEVVDSDDGLRILGTTFADNELGFAIGNRPFNRQLAPGSIQNAYFENILYAFNPQTGEFTGLGSPNRQVVTVGDQQIDQRANGAGTQIRERGFIQTGLNPGQQPIGNQLVVPPATQVAGNGQTTPRIADGSSFRLQAGAQQFDIEFDAGPILQFNTDPVNGVFARETFSGSNQPVRFSLTAGGVTTLYELETGPVIVVNAAQIVDGANVTVTNLAGQSRVFEFNSDGQLNNTSAISVDFTVGQSSAVLAEALAAAISDAGLAVGGFATPGQGRVDLTGDSVTSPPVVAGSGLSISGAHGSNDPSAQLIPVREDFTAAELAAAIAEATGGAAAGNRVNWPNVTATNISNLSAIGIATETGSAGVAPGRTAVRFLVSDSAEVIALRVAQVVNNNATLQAAGISVTANDRTLVFANAVLNAADGSVSPAFTVAGVPPGGLVTGITMVGNTLYAVSNNGGLYAVANPRATVQGQIGTYVASATDLIGLSFTSLTTGPTNVPGLLDEVGRPLLFGATAAGRLYAFDVTGRLRPVFAGGATSVALGAGVSGIEFSTLDFNLWHTTQRRALDEGHGIGVPYNDVSEDRLRIAGGTSFYFGAERLDSRFPFSDAQSPFFVPRQDGQAVEGTYNFPGGAKGALQSDPFSLVGYSAADLPMLYFNYFLETDGVDGVIESDEDGTFGRNQDAFRVYVIAEDGVQHLLATNNLVTEPGPFYNDEFDDPSLAGNPLLAEQFDDDITIAVQPLFDNTDSWRQARASLSDFAGQDNLRLRIEFATGGAFGDGSLGLRAVPGSALVDGARFSVGGRTFEFDLGSTLTVPAGSQLAAYYAQDPTNPDHRATVVIGGTTYVLNDGTRNVGADEVNVALVLPGDGPLTTLPSETIATRLADAIETFGGATEQVTIDFTTEPNNDLLSATRLPRFSGNIEFSGSGSLQSAQDVDLYRLELAAGASLRATMVADGTSFQSNVRIFDSTGRLLAAGNSAANYTSDIARTVVVGFSSGSNDNYNPNVSGSGDAGIVGDYLATIEVTADLRVIQDGARLQVTGGVEAAPGADGLVVINGAPGTSGIAIPIDASMSATEVAVAMRRAIAAQFTGGVTSVYPITDDAISLVGLSIDDRGPLSISGIAAADRFGTNGPQRARANNFEGVYVDDFIIGLAERGEMAFNATNATNFIADPLIPQGAPARPTTGSYQLEIRDASEYFNSLAGQAFRGFDSNQRLASGTTITPLPAAQIVDGAIFRITDGVSTITFEMDLLNPDGTSNGVTGGRVRVALPSPTSLAPGSDGRIEVAEAIAAAINSPQVRSVLDVSAVAADGIDTRGNSRLNLFGDIVVLDADGVMADVTESNLRGDRNRDRSSQGVIVVENSRFSFNSLSGIDITRDAFADSGLGSNPTVLTYPRNLVQLNTQNQIPGVVVQSNVMAYNGLSGLQITGLGDGQSINDPVGFDRIINNTIVGGNVRQAVTPEPGQFGGVFFPAGLISFADVVTSFVPGSGVSPGFANPNRALGAPDSLNPGEEPETGEFTTSLGNGGVLTLGFTDNYLTGSGDARPDLVVFETGEIESVRVEISRDGVTFFDVGVVGGIDNTIDIDEFGFGPQDRFSFVRLTDLRQGSQTTGPVGADIDAVGAISSVPVTAFNPGGRGIVVQQNSAPTLLNNVIANTQSGLVVDGTSLQTVIGGTSYYRNVTNATNPQAAPLGLLSQVLSPSLDLFVDPVNSSFVPRAGMPIINSSIDSLEDRVGLLTVKSAIGLSPSPIIAPRLDVNGQLRVDSPTGQAGGGIGEQVFKDRGAEERADQFGPRAILISPVADELGQNAGQAVTRGTIFDAFDIQLIDGIAPVDPTPGVGVLDSSVTADSVLLTKDGVPLVEGTDYRFGYDASNNVIRLTPIAGIWEDDSVYVVRLLDATDAVLRLEPGSTFVDGEVTTLLTLTGEMVNFEVESGIEVGVNVLPALGQLDGLGLTIFDGSLELVFELDNNGQVLGNRIPVEIPVAATSQQVASALVAAINQTALNLTARSVNGRVQLLGPSTLTTVTPLVVQPQVFTISGEIGTEVGFGIRVPSENGLLSPDLIDGQTFRIQRGANLVRTFEIDFGNGTQTPGAIAVPVGANPTIESVANELVRVIGGAGLGLDPTNVGQGRVTLGGDANYSLNVSQSAFTQLGEAGQSATIPVVIPIDATIAEVVELYGDAIDGVGLPGVSFAVIGDRLVLNGVAAVSGTATVESPVIRDKVGNLLQSNRDTGTTELTVFIGGGFNFGNAPAPYPTRLADDGPRHRVDPAFSLGPNVFPDADAVIPGGSSNDGVAQVGTIASGSPAQFTIDVRADGRPFYVDAWIDWNRNGVFEPSEVTRFRSANATGNLPILGVGVNTVSIPVPAGTTAGPTWGRFRLSEVAGLGPIGAADSGEVEDLLILVQANPFQNPLNPADVNKSNTVTPLDALNILNLLAAYRQGGGTGAIPLNPPPAFLPSLVNQTFLPDVNGNGTVEPADALAVINEIARQRRAAAGEGEGQGEWETFAEPTWTTDTYLPVGEGLLASPLTVATLPDSRQTRVELPPELPTEVTQSSSTTQASVFDSPDLIALDELLDNLANDDRDRGEAGDSVDAVFAGLGLGL